MKQNCLRRVFANHDATRNSGSLFLANDFADTLVDKSSYCYFYGRDDERCEKGDLGIRSLQ